MQIQAFQITGIIARSISHVVHRTHSLRSKHIVFDYNTFKSINGVCLAFSVFALSNMNLNVIGIECQNLSTFQIFEM